MKRTWKEIELIAWLSDQFEELIEHTVVDRQTALDAVEITLEGLLVEVAESEEHFVDYFEVMRERGLALWRRRNLVGPDNESTVS